LGFDTLNNKLEQVEMATQLCQKCKQAHPGRLCDYDEKGECAETTTVGEIAPPNKTVSDEDGVPSDPGSAHPQTVQPSAVREKSAESTDSAPRLSIRP
jgi:hypothetical protein